MSIERHQVHSLAEGCPRTLHVYVPQRLERAAVLYMHDGQNIFDEGSELETSWGVDCAMDSWIAGGGAPWIVVGIDHRGTERIADDSPWEEPTAHAPARGDRLARFVAEEVTTFIDTRYRTTPTRAIAGSSLGGLMSLYTVARYPSVFARVGAFSPTTMWADSALFDLWTSIPARERLYVDVGAHERFEVEETVLDYGREVPRFVDHLRLHGQDPRFVLDPEGAHDEASWRRRFRDALPYLLG